MREILFRGVETDREEWVYGYLIHDSICNSTVPYIGYLSHEQADTENRDIVPVIPETVGQFTGLTDKNGKKIFEGDIVKYKEHILQVEYADDYASYFFHNNGSVIGECTAKYTKEYAEIIGNIHDNPELLEADE